MDESPTVNAPTGQIFTLRTNGQERMRIDREGRLSIGVTGRADEANEEQPSLSLEEMTRAWGEPPMDTGYFYCPYIPKIALTVAPPQIPIGHVRFGTNGFEVFDGTNWVPFNLPDFKGEFFHEETNAPIQKTKPRRVLSSR